MWDRMLYNDDMCCHEFCWYNIYLGKVTVYWAQETHQRNDCIILHYSRYCIEGGLFKDNQLVLSDHDIHSWFVLASIKKILLSNYCTRIRVDTFKCIAGDNSPHWIFKQTTNHYYPSLHSISIIDSVPEDKFFWPDNDQLVCLFSFLTTSPLINPWCLP